MSNNAGYDRVQLILDSEWEGLDTVLVLGSGDSAVRFAWDGRPVTVPASLLASPGYVAATVVGYLGDERLVTAAIGEALVVAESGDYGGQDPYPEQPDLLQQLMDAAREAREAAERADEAAESAETIVGSQNDYEYLKNLPSINGATVIGQAPGLEAYGAVSLTDDDISAICV